MLKSAWLATALLTAVTTLCAAAPQPHMLFIIADDLCFQQVRSAGHDPVIQTPSLDRLAARGTAFDRCYNMGSYSGAVCVASRTMLNSGRTLWRANHIYKTSEAERQAGRWWSESLKRSGYRTYLTGKWHCQAKAEAAFDVARNVRGGMPQDTPAAYNRPLEGRPDPWSPTDRSLGGFWEGGKHWSEVVADDAVAYLSEVAARPEPAFLYVAFNAPHDPRQSPQEFLDRYPLDEQPLPVNYLPEYPHKDAIGCGRELRDEKLAPFPRTEFAVWTHRREYYAAITHLDEQIGRVLEAADRLPDGRELWIFFTADHGLAVGQHGLLGKQNLYEHSVRVPFLAAGPGVEAGRRVAAPIYLQDVHPTTLELAGVPQPEHVEFQSLLPLLHGETRSAHDPVYGAYLNLQRSITKDGWKLLLYPQARVARLYHVAEDPHELHDLAGRPETAARQRELFAALQGLQERYGDPLDLRATFPQWQ